MVRWIQIECFFSYCYDKLKEGNTRRCRNIKSLRIIYLRFLHFLHIGNNLFSRLLPCPFLTAAIDKNCTCICRAINLCWGLGRSEGGGMWEMLLCFSPEFRLWPHKLSSRPPQVHFNTLNNCYEGVWKIASIPRFAYLLTEASERYSEYLLLQRLK